MRIKPTTLGILAVMLLLGSCSTPQNISYFQDIETGTVINPSTQMDIRVQPEDKLSIIVTTQDPALSQLFNLVTVQNRLGQTTSSTTPAEGASNPNDGRTAYYTVDKLGFINFPVLGKLDVAGKNRFEIAEFIESRLQEENLVKNPILSVEFANTGISILGEVSSPGRYEFKKDHMSIIDEIAMAGDLTVNREREDI